MGVGEERVGGGRIGLVRKVEEREVRGEKGRDNRKSRGLGRGGEGRYDRGKETRC